MNSSGWIYFNKTALDTKAVLRYNEICKLKVSQIDGVNQSEVKLIQRLFDIAA